MKPLKIMILSIIFSLIAVALISCTSAYSVMKKGQEKHRNFDHEGAIIDLTQAIALYSADNHYVGYTYINRGEARTDMCNFAGAIEDFDRAIAIFGEEDTAAADAFNGRGVAMKDSGEYAAAIIDFHQAIALYETDDKKAIAFTNSGIAKHRMGDFEGAIKNFSIAIELIKDVNIKFPVDYQTDVTDGAGYRYGKTTSQASLFPDPVYTYEYRVTIAAKAYNYRGNAKNKLGQKESAIIDYRGAIRAYNEYDPGDAFAFNMRGYAYFRLGEYDRAAKDFASAIKNNRNDSYPNMMLGILAIFNEQFNIAYSEFTGAIQKEINRKKRISEDEDILDWLSNPDNRDNADDVRNEINGIITPYKIP